MLLNNVRFYSVMNIKVKGVQNPYLMMSVIALSDRGKGKNVWIVLVRSRHHEAKHLQEV